ncbi:MAG: tetratricopeptide repeat protein [Myxococcota bacterium]
MSFGRVSLAALLCAVVSAGLASAQGAPPAPAPAKKAPTGGGKKDGGVAAPDAGAPSPIVPSMPDGGITGGEKADVGPATGPKTRYFEGMGAGRSAQEQALLEEISRAIASYEEDSKEFRREVQLLVEKKYEEKRNTLANSYEKAIRDLEVLERRERLDAIAAFEEFLQRYPNDPRYTPDVMFRLAELYYERTSDEHALAMREFEETLKKLDPEKNPTAPPEPKVDFSKSIALYQRLIADFPGYKLNDASHYLLGYCQEKQEDFEKARGAYELLIAKYPKSKFTTEAWVRIGEYYFDAFDVPDALARAAEAYEHAIEDTKHPLYDKALYKLGWVYYRMDRFDDAVARFIALIDFYEAEAKRKGEEVVGGDLRNEALQYTAISFVDEKWGSLAKAQETFGKLGGRRYEAEIYRRMGDVYFDQTKHPDAIEAYRLTLQKDPLNKEAPQIQQRIVQAYERDRRLEEAFAESSKLSNMFVPGTPWHEKWKRDPDVVVAAQELAEKSLYSTAVYHHQQALVYKQEGKFDQAKVAFEVAAKAYLSYLQRFPRSKNAYEMEFYLAECQYNSFQFAEAAKHYAAVRDSSQDNRYLNDAAYAAVLANQKQLELEWKSGTTKQYPVLISTARPEGEKVVPIELSPTEKALVDASDKYLAKAKGGEEKAPGIAYKAAELFYTHNQFDEARARFEKIIANYCTSEVAQYAINLSVETYLIDKNWSKVEEVAGLMTKNQCVDPKSELAKSLTKFKLGGRFKFAEELMAKGQYDEAAKKYLELVSEEPKHEFADKALNNAAVCYENVQRFDSALKIYERIFSEYPQSKLADSALFRVAVNAEKSYDFDKAIEKYQKLVKDYPQAKDRESALFNTARLLEGLQRYSESAQAYLRYADLYPQSEDAPKNQFRAALIYEKMNDPTKEIGALREFVQKFSGKPAQAELVIDAKKRIGDSYMKLKKETEAKKAFKDAADDFDRRGLKPDTSPIAADAAAYSRFQLAEFVFAEFDKLKIGGTGKNLAASFTRKKEAVKKVNAAFDEVVKYKRVEWILAAFYRKGYTLERFAQTILETPVPPEIKRLGEEAVITYQDQLAAQTVALEDKAVETYAAAWAEAKKYRVSNEWTKKTLESLNRFRPKEYPMLKDPRSALASDLTYPDGAINSITGNEKATQAPQKLGGDDK